MEDEESGMFATACFLVLAAAGIGLVWVGIDYSWLFAFHCFLGGLIAACVLAALTMFYVICN